MIVSAIFWGIVYVLFLRDDDDDDWWWRMWI